MIENATRSPRSDGTTAPEPRFVIAGVNHRTAGQELRDALFVEDAQIPDFYRRLREAGLEQILVLATCDRVEVAAVAADVKGGAAEIRRALLENAGLAPGMLDHAYFALSGRDGLTHLFRIAASLESEVVGEPEVLGQVKAAQRRAGEFDALKGYLGRVVDAALAAAKRARTETALGECAVSIVSAGSRVAREVLGRFEDASALMLGGAEFGVSVIERLRADGLSEITVADPLGPRADALAARLGAHRLPMADVPARLADFDIVLGGLGAQAPTIRREDLGRALKARRFRPIFLLDAAVPPDVEKGVRDLDDAFLFDLHDLERIALVGQEQRSGAAAQAARIVDEEVAAFIAAEGGRAVAGVVSDLRDHFERVRAELLKERPGLSAEEATRLLVNRLLHEPSRSLREAAAEERAENGPSSAPAGRDSNLATFLARLFGLSPRGPGNKNGRSK